MSTGKKLPLSIMAAVAGNIVERLAPFCERIEVAGSIRRCRPTVGDVEIVALPKRPLNLLGEAVTGVPSYLDTFLDGRVTFTKNGPLYKQFSYGKHTVDLFLPATPAHWGCVYFIRTGSNEWNQYVMRHLSPAAAVQFQDGRLLRRYDGTVLETPEEADVFKLLCIPFVPPQLRDDNRWEEVLRG